MPMTKASAMSATVLAVDRALLTIPEAVAAMRRATWTGTQDQAAHHLAETSFVGAGTIIDREDHPRLVAIAEVLATEAEIDTKGVGEAGQGRLTVVVADTGVLLPVVTLMTI